MRPHTSLLSPERIGTQHTDAASASFGVMGLPIKFPRADGRSYQIGRNCWARARAFCSPYSSRGDNFSHLSLTILFLE